MSIVLRMKQNKPGCESEPGEPCFENELDFENGPGFKNEQDFEN